MSTTTTPTSASKPDLKFFKVTAEEIELGLGTITLRVDLNLLTVELATEINNFWSNNTHRLQKEHGNVVYAVIRLFGAAAISHMLADNGACFGRSNSEAGRAWTSSTLREQYEGWPDMDALGILIVEASVTATDFDSVSIMEVGND